jgi:hypothetical protein
VNVALPHIQRTLGFSGNGLEWAFWSGPSSRSPAPAARSGHAQLSAQVRASIYHHALAVGIPRGFLTASGIALPSLVITVITIRIRREDLTGTPEPA